MHLGLSLGPSRTSYFHLHLAQCSVAMDPTAEHAPEAEERFPTHSCQGPRVQTSSTKSRSSRSPEISISTKANLPGPTQPPLGRPSTGVD